jgi:hypothetical protein
MLAAFPAAFPFVGAPRPSANTKRAPNLSAGSIGDWETVSFVGYMRSLGARSVFGFSI